MPNLCHPGEKSWLPAKDNSSPPISASEVGTNKSAAEWKGWKCLKVTHRFPLPPWLCWEWGGGGKKHTKRQEDLRGGRGSSSSAAAWSKHFQRLPLIEKICFHLSQIGKRERGEGKEIIALSWCDEGKSSSSAGRWSAGWERWVWVKRPKGSERMTEFFNRRM